MIDSPHVALLGLMLPGGFPDPDPIRYSQTPEGFGRWLADLGVQRINPLVELCVPPADRVDHWIRAGRPSLVPPRAEWPALGSVCVLVDRRRVELGTPLIYRYGYRPVRFNTAIGGSKGSDHLTACAVDVTARGVAEQRALLSALKPFWISRVFGLSLGYSVAGLRVHVGIWAPRTLARGQRQWTYPDGGPLRF